MTTQVTLTLAPNDDTLYNLTSFNYLSTMVVGIYNENEFTWNDITDSFKLEFLDATGAPLRGTTITCTLELEPYVTACDSFSFSIKGVKSIRITRTVTNIQPTVNWYEEIIDDVSIHGSAQVAPTPTLTPVPVTATPRVKHNSKYNDLLNQVRKNGTLRIIVQFSTNLPNNMLHSTQFASTESIAAGRDKLLLDLIGYEVVPITRPMPIPFIGLIVDEAALRHLIALPEVTLIQRDNFYQVDTRFNRVRGQDAKITPTPVVPPMTLGPRVELIGAVDAWNMGFEGTEQIIAILDSGVDAQHPTLKGRVIEEACFGFFEGKIVPTCPNLEKQVIGIGAAMPTECFTIAAAKVDNAERLEYFTRCGHGTEMASIAIGNDGNFTGVAKSAHIIAVNMFVQHFADDPKDREVFFTDSSLLNALTWVYEVNDNNTHKITAINLSAGISTIYHEYSDDLLHCDNKSVSVTQMITTLREVGIPSIVAAGNDSMLRGTAFPACVSTAISVAASDDNDDLWPQSNTADWLNLIAPGVDIVDAIPTSPDDNPLDTNNDGFLDVPGSGTSNAAAHVSSAWAIIKEVCPQANVDDVLKAFSTTTSNVKGEKAFRGDLKLRINVKAALDWLENRNCTAN